MATSRLVLGSRHRARHARPSSLPGAAGTIGTIGVAAATAVALLPGGPAGAEPGSPGGSAADLERRVSALRVQADTAVEDHHEAALALARAEQQARSAQAKLEREEAAYEQARADAALVAAAAYRRGGSDRLAALVLDAPARTFLDRASSLDRLGRDTADRLAAASTARARTAAARAQAQAELAAARDAAASVRTRRAEVERTLRTQRELLAGLRASERRRLAAAQAARASRSDGGRVEVVPADVPASGRASVAVAEAHRKLGSPYQWGASGPDRFDCSGLTSWVWAKAGVSLPHSSRAQYSSGRKVARSDLQPGDLVYYGSPIHHVGIYIGGGRMISAPQTGDVVKVQDAFRRDYVGATRP